MQKENEELKKDLDEEVKDIIEESETEVKDEENKEDSVESNESVEKADAIKEQFIRLQADFANYKRRTENEKKDYIELGVKKIVNDLLPVVDNFERALQLETEDKSFLEGIEMIYKQFCGLLEKNSIVEIKSQDEKFDPNLHHAVLVEEREGVEEGIVIEVLQKGYMINDKVLRPAIVKVSN